MATQRNKIHGIIHAVSFTTACVGAGLAQFPGSDAPILVTLQAAMIQAIAMEHGTSISKSAAADLVLTFAATMAGRGFTQWAGGWVPGWGNAINASTAAALTEAVGWAADSYFEEGTASAG